MLMKTLLVSLGALLLLNSAPTLAAASPGAPAKAERTSGAKAAMKEEVDKLRLQHKEQFTKLHAQQKDQRDKLKAEQKAQLAKLKADQHVRLQKLHGQLAAIDPPSSGAKATHSGNANP